MEYLNSILESSTTPAVTALILGLLTAISPCPLATNIAAVGYLARDVASPRRILLNGILYALGRIVAYTALGAALILILRTGAGVFPIERAAGRWSEILLPPAMILAGMYMLFGSRLRLTTGAKSSGVVKAPRNGVGAFLIGMLFAMAFCPTSGVFYFGMLIPMSAAAAQGFALPALFAAATALPVVATAWVLAYGANRLGNLYNRLTAIERWLTRIVAAIFIITGIAYAITTFIG